MLDRNIRVDYAPPKAEIVPQPYHKLYFYDFKGDEQTIRDALGTYETSIISIFFRMCSSFISSLLLLILYCPLQ